MILQPAKLTKIFITPYKITTMLGDTKERCVNSDSTGLPHFNYYKLKQD